MIVARASPAPPARLCRLSWRKAQHLLGSNPELWQVPLLEALYGAMALLQQDQEEGFQVGRLAGGCWAQGMLHELLMHLDHVEPPCGC
jgi:hypothetical protein